MSGFGASLPIRVQPPDGPDNEEMRHSLTSDGAPDWWHIQGALSGRIFVVAWADPDAVEGNRAPVSAIRNRIFISEYASRPFVNELQRLGVAYSLVLMSVQRKEIL